MLRPLILGSTLLLVLVACAGGTADTTSTEVAESATTAPSTTALPSTQPTEPEPSTQLITASRKQLSVLPDGLSLTAGLEATLGPAFDDYAGGLVFSQATTVNELWHLRSGREEPVLLYESPAGAPFAFFDLVAPTGRPPTALFRSGDLLLLLPITGGAAEELPIGDLAAVGSGGDFRTASLGGSSLMVAWSDPVTACVTVDLFTLAGEPTQVGLFETCEGAFPVMSDEGDVIVTIEVGASAGAVIRSVSDGLERDRWQVAAVRGTFHVSGGQIAYADGTGVSLLTYAGTWEALVPPANIRVDGVTIARAPVIVSELATLGGFAALQGCSSSNHAPLGPQDGLTDAAATIRSAIGNAVVECDLARLGSLLDGSLDPAVDPTADWWASESRGFPVLLELVNLLETPFAAVEDDEGFLVFVWPAVAVGVDDDEAWTALRTLYNEEDIDRWKSGADPYDRLVVRITEDGRWIQASSEF